MLLKPLLSKHAKKAGETAAFAVAYTSARVEDQPARSGSDTEACDRNFTYADAERVTTLLLEQSRRCKSGFFKAEKPRRPLKDRRTLSENCLMNGIDAPSSTPDVLHLSRYPSTKSTGSTRSCLEIGCHTSKVSLAHADPTSADLEPQPSPESSQPREPSVSKDPIPDSVSPPPASRCLHRSLSFQGRSNLLQSKVRKLANAFQVWAPLRRAKIRDGKQQAMDIDHTPVFRRASRPPPREYLEAAFLKPSTSREFENFKLEGGKGAPKYMSEKDLDRLDQIEKEEAEKLLELSSLRSEKEMILWRAEFERHPMDTVKDAGKKEAKKEKDKKDASAEARKSSSLIPSVSPFNMGFAS